MHVKVRSGVPLLLCLLLNHSSFSLTEYLNGVFLKQSQTPTQLNYGLSLKLTSAYQLAFSTSTRGSAPWLRYGQILARNDADYAWLMAVYFSEQEDRQYSQLWYNKALKLGSEEAITQQVQAFLEGQRFNKQKLVTIKNTLMPVLGNNQTIKNLAIELAIWGQDISWLQELHPRLNRKQKSLWLQWFDRVKFYPMPFGNVKQPLLQSVNMVSNAVIKDMNAIQQRKNCINPIQFFATSKANIDKVNGHIATLSSNDFYQQQFCFLPVRYISEQDLACKHAEKSYIHCKEDIYGSMDIDSNVRYIATMVPFGGANVNHGILYFDSHDDINVLEHELLHLLGFIDEYPLPRQHIACNSKEEFFVRQNMFITRQLIFQDEQQARARLKDVLPWFEQIKASTPITHTTVLGAKLGTPDSYAQEVGLFLSNTCDLATVSAFKPIAKASQMQHFELALDPVYQRIATAQGKDLKMPSYLYNLGLDAQYKGKVHLAKEWFNKAAEQEKTRERQNLISHGIY